MLPKSLENNQNITYVNIMGTTIREKDESQRLQIILFIYFMEPAHFWELQQNRFSLNKYDLCSLLYSTWLYR